MSPKNMIEYAMLGFDVEFLEDIPVGYHCDCSRDRMERAIISLGKKEISDMIEEQGEAEIICQFCNQAYRFEKEDLAELLDKATRA